MSAVSEELRKTILELQNFSSLLKFALGGGTNLAIRYQHRISIDIDFISPYIIGKKGFGKIISELEEHFGNRIMKSILINEDLGEQY